MQHTGSSVNPQRQRGPHAHSVNVSPDNRFAIVADLGLDKLMVYRFDAAKGALTPNDPPFAAVKPGSGPRHFAFHPSGKFAYVINELGLHRDRLRLRCGAGRAHRAADRLDAARRVSPAAARRPRCRWTPRGSSCTAPTAAMTASPCSPSTPRRARSRPVEHVPTQGKTPRNFRIDPTGSYLFAANQNSGSVVIFRVDAKTGRLTPTGKVLEVASPVCVKFVPAK